MAEEKIGKYQIIGELGKGAMGIVYKAKDPHIKRTVAIKTIRFDMINQSFKQEETVERFIREAQSAGILSHPNIVTIYDVGEDNGTTYIVMEYIEGTSLEDVIASGTKKSTGEIVDIMIQLGDALDYAHEKGIVHRDIKPGNILIDNEGKPHLVDFGIAHISESTLTQSGMTLGTPNYMSPEQISGKKLDRRSDIFSLGAVFYELLTGARPFAGDNITTVIYKIMHEEPRSIKSIDNQLHEGLQFIINKVLAKNPNLRYQDCVGLAEDLNNYTNITSDIRTSKLKKTIIESTEVQDFSFIRKKNNTPKYIMAGLGILVAAAIAVFLLFPDLFKPAETKPSYSAALDSGIMSFREKDFDGCISKMEVLLKIDPNNQKARNYLAEAKRLKKESAAGSASNKNTKSGKILDTAIRDAGKDRSEIKKQDTPETGDKKIIEKKVAASNNKKEIQKAVKAGLEKGIKALETKNYQEAVTQLQKVLQLEPGNKKAAEHLTTASNKLAYRQLYSIYGKFGNSIKNGTLYGFYQQNCTNRVFQGEKDDAKLLFQLYRDMKPATQQPNINLTDLSHGTVRFYYMLTGVSKTDGVRKQLQEGIYTWNVEKLKNNWKIVKIKYESKK
ncbi:MAG: protein kinase [bacterium]|nr:protein kinase [bacterium]